MPSQFRDHSKATDPTGYLETTMDSTGTTNAPILLVSGSDPIRETTLTLPGSRRPKPFLNGPLVGEVIVVVLVLSIARLGGSP